MSKIDDLLQQKLEALESGQTLDKVLEELPEEARELGALISLASALQTMPHPQPQMQNSLASIQTAAARKTIRPAHRRRPIEWAWPRLAFGTGGVGVALILIFMLISLSALGVWMAGPRAAHVATLMDVSGVVGVGPGDSADGWELVSDGSQVGEGQRVRTGTQGSVTLVFFDGSRTTLGPDTDLALSKVDGRWGNVLQVELSQRAGDTNHSVVPFQGKKSAYLVHTPSGTVSVHGTIFNISVNEMGQARFAVDTGEVMVTGQDSEVTLEAGQTTTAQSGQTLESPAYQFKLEGILTDDEGDTWAVNDVAFQVTGETLYEGNPEYGSYVEVKGHVGEGGALLADKIEVISGGDVEMSFTGVVESMGKNEWVISGKSVFIKDFTEFDSDIEEGHTVKVTFIVVEDQQWQALSIRSLEVEPPVEVEPEETQEPDSDAAPETEDAAQETDCTGVNPHPKGQALADKYEVSYDEIMGWFCQGFGFGEIDLAYSLLSEENLKTGQTYDVEGLFAKRDSGLGWGQIKKNPGFIDASGTISDTITTEPIEGEGTQIQSDEGEASCMGKEAKKGQNMAQRLGVGFSAIEQWYCLDKHALNEIDHAFGLSKKTGRSVQEILDMRSVGLNWGQIQKELSPNPNPKSNPKPVKTKKPKKP
jgi:hypothetical protein